MPSHITRYCRECGTAFTVPKPSHKKWYCSPACRYGAHARSQDRQTFVVCATCGVPFHVTPSRAALRRHCSDKCRREADAAMYRATLPDRFWSKVDRSGGPDACWPWTGSKNPQTGYGVIQIEGRHTGTHRVAWELANGKPLGDLVACHHCDNPICCNPSHIFAGTHGDNSRDRFAKGRKGNLPAKLNDAKAEQIRQRYAAGDVTHRQLAREFGVGPTTIADVVNGKRWV